MDADCQERRRDYNLSQREKRWSMNSQRLEEIVAELMKPISDVRRSFDTDLSALLEEYLTEAGLHALAAEEDDEEPAPAAVNFAELALLLQHSASVYGRKVDLLYQRVLDVSDSLLNSTQEVAGSSSAEPATPSRRKRRASGAAAGFAPLSLASSAAARRDPAAPRPPPTLPRIYIELEPRALAACDAPLTDYEGEPIGLLPDFHVTWRLQDGILVDELEGGGSQAAGGLRPIPLCELSAALAASAPPEPPPPPRCSTPLDGAECRAHGPAAPLDDTLDSAIEMTPVAKAERKRKCEAKVDDVGRIKLLISKALRRELATAREFSVAREWVASVVGARKRRLLAARRALRERAEDGEFRGFDYSTACEAGGFCGWSDAEGAVATERALAGLRRDVDSDDDGFFEQSSLGDSDASRCDDAHALPVPATPTFGGVTCNPQAEEESDGWSEWQRGVLARAAQGEARALDVRALAERLMDALPPRGAAAAFPRVLRAARAAQHDVAGLFLATLFLANSGNVEIVPGRALELNAFGVRLVSRDQRLLSAAAAAAAADGIS